MFLKFGVIAVQEVQEVQEVIEEINDAEEFSLSTIVISGVNLVIAVANVISLAKLHYRAFEPKDPPPRRIYQSGEPRGSHD